MFCQALCAGKSRLLLTASFEYTAAFYSWWHLSAKPSLGPWGSPVFTAWRIAAHQFSALAWPPGARLNCTALKHLVLTHPLQLVESHLETSSTACKMPSSAVSCLPLVNAIHKLQQHVEGAVAQQQATSQVIMFEDIQQQSLSSSRSHFPDRLIDLICNNLALLQLVKLSSCGPKVDTDDFESVLLETLADNALAIQQLTEQARLASKADADLYWEKASELGILLIDCLAHIQHQLMLTPPPDSTFGDKGASWCWTMQRALLSLQPSVVSAEFVQQGNALLLSLELQR